MWEPLPLCLLSSLLATGSALLCEVCESKEESCFCPLQLFAPLEGTCLIGVAGFSVGANSFSYMAKSCLAPKSCEPSPFTVTYQHNITVRVNITCCDTDGCNAGVIPVPAVSLVPSGWHDATSWGQIAARTWSLYPALDPRIIVLSSPCDITMTKAAAGCGSPGGCIKRVGVKKYIQSLVDMLSWANCYPAPRAGGEL
ncbi:unnamed protein product [Caretta caretta]